MHAVRMWFSRGNTTSSQHFDTHDNLMLQIDGIKDIYLSHPNESAKMYMDHHDKYGLSPVNVDRVDLERFPHVANASVQHVRLMPGDALYIPDGYWHVIKSTDRNLALAFEINPRRLAPEPWTPTLNELYEHPGRAAQDHGHDEGGVGARRARRGRVDAVQGTPGQDARKPCRLQRVGAALVCPGEGARTSAWCIDVACW